MQWFSKLLPHSAFILSNAAAWSERSNRLVTCIQHFRGMIRAVPAWTPSVRIRRT